MGIASVDESRSLHQLHRTPDIKEEDQGRAGGKMDGRWDPSDQAKGISFL